MATIEKRVSKDGDISYRVRVRLKGHPEQTATFTRLTEARNYAENTASAIRERRHFKTAEAKKHTLAEVIDKYNRTVLSKRPRSEAFRKQQLEWWRKEIGPYSLADITPALLSDCKEKLAKGKTQNIDSTTKEKTTRSAATINRYLAALSHALSVAANQWQWLESNPMLKVEKEKEPRGRVRYLSDEERENLLKACKANRSKSLYPIVVLALATGMRKSEVCGLTWEDVDFRTGRITLRETKNGEVRVVPLRGHAKEILEAYSKVRRIRSNLVFPGDKADQPIKIGPTFNSAVKKAGISDFRFHDLRHSCASYLAMNGCTLLEIAEVLGHKTLAMVKRYSHLAESHTAEVVEKMNKKIFG